MNFRQRLGYGSVVNTNSSIVRDLKNCLNVGEKCLDHEGDDVTKYIQVNNTVQESYQIWIFNDLSYKISSH